MNTLHDFLNTLWGIGHSGLWQVVERNMVVCFVGSKLYMQNSDTTTCALELNYRLSLTSAFYGRTFQKITSK
jgi:hypothetical protein